MSTLHDAPGRSSPSSSTSSHHLTALNEALDQTSISSIPTSTADFSPSDRNLLDTLDDYSSLHNISESTFSIGHPLNPAQEKYTNNETNYTNTNVNTNKTSPKKRERTDSMKKYLPAPAAQRAKQQQRTSPGSSTSHQNEHDGLLIKNRKGKGMGVPRAHLILNAVEKAPPAKEKSNPRRWSKHEDESLRLAVERSGERNWKAIADQVPGRNHTQCLQRWTKVLKPGLIKGHWTPEEDLKLRDLVAEGKKNWGQVASLIPGRTSKQCRERWCNHLDPNINKGSYTPDEDKIIVEMQAKLGNRWSIIAQQLKGRTEDAVKIRWKSLMRGRRAASKEDKALSDTNSISSTSSSITSVPNTEKPPMNGPKILKGPTSAKSATTSKKNSTGSTVDSAPQTSSTKKNTNVKEEKNKGQTNSNPKAKNASYPSSQSMSTSVDPNMSPFSSYANTVNDIVATSIHNFKVSNRIGESPSNISTPEILQSTTSSPLSYQQQQQQLTYQSIPTYGLPQSDHTNSPYFVLPANFNQLTLQQQQTYQHQHPFHPSHHVPLPQQQIINGATDMQHQPPYLPPYGPQGYHVQQLHQQQYPTSNAMSLARPQGPDIPQSPHTANLLATAQHLARGSVTGRRHSASAKLSTPREEWGSSQTPRSQMIQAEGQASVNELFHQQRMRLMIEEQREKSTTSFSAVPSPGQAMLTQELEKQNKRQQTIMKKGWKSAVEAMLMRSDDNGLRNSEFRGDQLQRFDGLFEKVPLAPYLDSTHPVLDTDDLEMVDNSLNPSELLGVDESLEAETPIHL